MDEHAIAEELPGLYRAILDGVARLEVVGERGEAGRIRREATNRYSAAWDERCRRDLNALLKRLDRTLAARSHEHLVAPSYGASIPPSSVVRTEIA